MASFFDRSKKAKVKIRLANLPEDPNEMGGLILQFFPESIQDSYQTNWNNKQVPGGSHPLYFWESGGPRTISFTIILARESLKSISQANAAAAVTNGFSSLGGDASDSMPAEKYIKKIDNYNIDINEAVRWLRSQMRPRYIDNNGVRMVKPPNKLKLVFEKGASSIGDGLLIGPTGNERIIDCILNSCEVTYTKLHMDGTPRYVTVDVSFDEVVQNETGIVFQGM